MVGLLESGPGRVAEAARAVSDGELVVRSETERWSVNDVLAHLRACQDVRARFVNEMLNRDRPTLPYISPRTFIRRTNYPDLPFTESLAGFSRDRQSFVGLLRSLSPEQWLREAEIKNRTETVLMYVEYLAGHEIPHLGQIDQLVSGRM